MNHRLETLQLIEKKSVKKLGFVAFLLGIAFSSVTAVWAIFINGFVNSDATVGLISSLFTVFSFLSFFLIIPLVEKSNKYRLLIFSSLVMAIFYISFFFINNFYLFLIIASILAIIGAVRASAFGLLVRNTSSRSNISKNEGVVYTLANLSFLLGPLAVGLLSAIFETKVFFLFAGGVLIVSTIFLAFSNNSANVTKKRLDKNILKNLVDFFKNKERVKSYLLRLGVSFWWSLIYIYIPLMIIKDLDKMWVGIFLGLVTIPLILFEYYFGKKAGRVGYRKLFFLGFLIPSIMSILCFFLYQNIILVLVLLSIASLGLAMLESTTESYFFDLMKGKEEQRFYSPYNTSIDCGGIIGKLAPSALLFILPFQYIFLFFALGMAILAFVSLTTKKIVEGKRKN